MPPSLAPAEILVTFAVEEEARPLRGLLSAESSPTLLITGIGSAKATAAVHRSFEAHQPALVVSSGFAGGLNPALRCGDLLFAGDAEAAGGPAVLEATGARLARFEGSGRVLTRATEKAALWTSTHADAVEMESHAIAAFCRERHVPCLILRVISDPARDDLPLDFNRFLQADGTLHRRQVLWSVARRITAVPALLRFRQQTQSAAQRLALALHDLLRRLTARS